MIGMLIAVVIFNFIVYKTNKRLTLNQIVHIWTFSIALQSCFDIFVEFKFHGYWYFDKEIDWPGLIPHLLIVPPVNIIFLNFFPFKSKTSTQITYLFFFVIVILAYEKIALLPEPFGYFHYGWWRLWHAVILDPILLFILLGFYKWICKLERRAGSSYEKPRY
ncbi:hypothetical protein FB550_12196 [Neobacillus bataviensis]|uniref:FAR-17a/AIG1-like protein n=1 Tax=Neobacillus bataviensis TaxID=220685 RepID=A0A561CKL5_9BACI|nr:hypothetical protein [Neobacillus bataviensis]TWD91654.1 hypothetical protein FB550_12196 [Neobacillus bataviensis]